MQDIRPAFRIQALSGQDVGVMRAMLAMFGEAFEGRATYIRKPNLMTQIALYTKLGVREDVLHFDILPVEGGV